MTLTLSLVGHLEVLGQIKFWSPASMKRHRGAVLRFGKFLGRAGDVDDLTAETIARYAEAMTAAGLADWTVEKDAALLRCLAKHVEGDA